MIEAGSHAHLDRHGCRGRRSCRASIKFLRCAASFEGSRVGTGQPICSSHAHQADRARSRPVRMSFSPRRNGGSCYVLHTGSGCVLQLRIRRPKSSVLAAAPTRSPCKHGALECGRPCRTSVQANVGVDRLRPELRHERRPTATVRVVERQRPAPIHQVVNLMGRVRSCSPGRASLQRLPRLLNRKETTMNHQLQEHRHAAGFTLDRNADWRWQSLSHPCRAIALPSRTSAHVQQQAHRTRCTDVALAAGPAGRAGTLARPPRQLCRRH